MTLAAIAPWRRSTDTELSLFRHPGVRSCWIRRYHLRFQIEFGHHCDGLFDCVRPDMAELPTRVSQWLGKVKWTSTSQ